MSQYIPGEYAYTVQMFTSEHFVVMRHRIMGTSKDRLNLSGFSAWWPKEKVYETHNEAIHAMIKRLEGMLQNK